LQEESKDSKANATLDEYYQVSRDDIQSELKKAEISQLIEEIISIQRKNIDSL
jgi:hypothetical protein